MSIIPKRTISFRIVAYTDAAGKYSPDAFRSGNEDNFYIDDDLCDDVTNKVAQDKIMPLGHNGMLMAVADGMGGMNAGEVASQIAVDTVKQAFSAENITSSITRSAQSRAKYLEHVIKLADKNIKNESRADKSHEGMGSTIILAWLYDRELTISWCGDSRLYIYNEKSGIRLVSQDHSYVQELVNKGMLTYDQTFDHPQNNIITRSLGDPTKDAKPESKTVEIGKGDIILLCSDGLSGVLRDRKTYSADGNLYPDANIEDIVRANATSMKACREALWEAAEKADWYDNVTAILCQITDGPESPWANQTPVIQKTTKRKPWLIPIGILTGAIMIAAAFLLGQKYAGNNNVEVTVPTEIIPDSSGIKKDTVAVEEHKPEVTKPISEKPSVIEQVQKKSEEKASDKKSELTKIEQSEKKADVTTDMPTGITSKQKKLLDNPNGDDNKKDITNNK